jgi:hypothetical protein
MATKTQEVKIDLKVNIAKLKTQFLKDNPLINDLVYAGVAQFLGIKSFTNGIEMESSTISSMPNPAMIQFLKDMEILVTEDVEKEVALHS